MEKETLVDLLRGDFQKAYQRIQTYRKVADYADLKEQYDSNLHEINARAREDKSITVPHPERTILLPNGDQPTKPVKTAKLSISD
jgi:hypothetical protein